ncbi:MAG TPA: NADPH-dependent 7-cyano-7-deazaguanine reductase QueF [Desulfobacteraceae bacterium]|nr:NADPH-dependent 7-cyano-7-deazaguanine reductase QueF [Desulfobacteraceae bacterium]
MNAHNPLGEKVSHSRTYDPSQLFAVDRQSAREASGISDPPPFWGRDIWNAYEISWLNHRGKPVVAIGEFVFPCDTPCIVESKSLKLYLNAFNQTRFGVVDEVAACIRKDLSACVKGNVKVSLVLPDAFETELAVHTPQGACIDHLDVDIDTYHTDAGLLATEDGIVKEVLYSNLLRTNCPVTEQPDWGTVIVDYRGEKISRQSLLAYLVSYRDHTGFHENCTEQIFSDIKACCRPDHLTVTARFTRRGGIDINPVRTDRKPAKGSCADGSPSLDPMNLRLARQ